MATNKHAQNALEQLAGFDELSNMFGPLKGDIRKRLAAVLKNPTDKTWSNAHSIIIGGGCFRTLWQCWIAVDPTAPRTGPVTDAKGKRISGWSRIPNAEEIFSAIRYAAIHKKPALKA